MVLHSGGFWSPFRRTNTFSLGHAGAVCLTQHGNHLLFGESTLSHGLLAGWEPSSQASMARRHRAGHGGHCVGTLPRGDVLPGRTDPEVHFTHSGSQQGPEHLVDRGRQQQRDDQEPAVLRLDVLWAMVLHGTLEGQTPREHTDQHEGRQPHEQF